MSETTTTTDTPAVTPAVTATPLEAQPKLFDEAYVKSLRDEAAAARVAKKDAVEAAVKEANDKFQAELASRDTALAETQNELSAARLDLEKYKIAVEAEVPSSKVAAFVSILQGTDTESIRASAQAAYDLAGGFKTNGPAYDPTQGFGGSAPLALNGDPILQALKGIAGIQ